MPGLIPTSTFPPKDRPVTAPVTPNLPIEEYKCPYCATISRKNDRCPNCGASRVSK